MAGYLGKSQGVTQVDGYNRAEADAEFLNQSEGDTRYVNAAGDTMSGNLKVRVFGNATSSVQYGTGLEAKLNAYAAETALELPSPSVLFKLRGKAGAIDTLTVGATYSGTEREGIVLDYLGRVTTPYQPAFHASRNSDVSWGNYDITFATQTLDRGNNFNGTIFTAPVAGVYFFTATLSLAGGTTGQDDTMYWGFLKNGANYQILNDNWSFLLGTGGNGVDMTVSQSALISLSANDNVKVNVSGISHTGGLIQAGSSFSGYLVG